MKRMMILGSILAFCAGLSAATHDVRAFGAVGDGRTKDTAAVQRALDACAGTGGRVVVPPGTYLIGSIFLGDDTELHLEKGATLLGSPDLADYNEPDAYPQNWCSVNEGWSAKHLILVLEKKGVSITGRGVIDGNGRAFFADKPMFRGKVCWRDGGINARDYKHQARPGQEIVFIECRDVSVRDVTFRDMSCWSCFFHGCENVTVGGVTVRNGLCNLNTDGFDVDSCRNVRIGDCDIVTGDDAIAIRGSPARLKNPAKVCENVRVSNIVCRVSADGVRVGVGDGTIRNVRVSDMKIEHAGRGLHVQCCYGKKPKKGVDILDVMFERISIKDTAQAIFVGASSPDSKATLRDIRFDGVDAEGEMPIVVAGGGETRVRGVSFANCTFRPVRSRGGPVEDREAGKLSSGNNGAIRIERADSVVFRACTLRWDGGADANITHAFSVYEAEPPSVDGLSRMPDRK
jgi:polygalacturonase